jgi:predicted component of type VI protein secretion system
VPLADVLEYSLLSTLNRVALQHLLEQQAAPPESN